MRPIDYSKCMWFVSVVPEHLKVNKHPELYYELCQQLSLVQLRWLFWEFRYGVVVENLRFYGYLLTRNFLIGIWSA